MKLSILVATLPEPYYQNYLTRLNSILDPQVAKHQGQVEIIIHDAGRSMPTGKKRNEMINYSTGDYMCHVDCDDVVTNDYVDKIMEGIEKDIDVVTFCGWMTTNQRAHVDFIIKLGEKYEERGGKYYRFPNHLAVMKRERVERIKFPEIWNGEDYKYAKEIHDKGLLKTEHHITKQIYHYDFFVNKPRQWDTFKQP